MTSRERVTYIIGSCAFMAYWLVAALVVWYSQPPHLARYLCADTSGAALTLVFLRVMWEVKKSPP
jgi:hypothetical protein